jgi:HEAT repeat protein
MLDQEQEKVRTLFDRLERLLHTAVNADGLPARERIAIELLGRGEEGERIVRRACLSADPGVRESSAYALGCHIPADIKETFRTGDQFVRTALCRAIADIGRSWDLDLVHDALRSTVPAEKLEALRAVRRLLNQELEFDEMGRAFVARDLRQPLEQNILYSVSHCLDSEDGAVRKSAAEMLAVIGPAAGLNLLMALDARHADARETARNVYLGGRMGPRTPFDYALETGDSRIRTIACRALKILVAEAVRREPLVTRDGASAFLESAVSRLARLCGDYSDEVRGEALKALDAAGRFAEPVLPTIKSMCSLNERFKIRENARQVVESIEASIRAHEVRPGEEARLESV